MERMKRPRVEIDLNVSNAEGLVRVRIEDLPAGVTEGSEVVAFEPDDEVAAPAEIVRIDHHLGFAYLRVDWDQIANDPCTKPMARA